MLVERNIHPEWLSNAYVVADRRGGTALFVDSGADPAPLVAAVEEWGVVPAVMLRTHAHHDHVAWEDDLCDRYGIPVVAAPGEWEWGGIRVRGVATPGHSDDMVAFLVGAELAFTGDTLFKDAVGGGDPALVRASVMDVFMSLARLDARPARPHGRDDDRPRARAQPVRARVVRRRAGGNGARAGRRPRRDAARLVARLRRQGQGVGALRRRRRGDRRRLARRASSSRGRRAPCARSASSRRRVRRRAPTAWPQRSIASAAAPRPPSQWKKLIPAT